jgi:hypothetical protein
MRSEFSLGNLKGKRLSVRPRRRWEDNIKTDLKEIKYVSFNL